MTRPVARDELMQAVAVVAGACIGALLLGDGLVKGLWFGLIYVVVQLVMLPWRLRRGGPYSGPAAEDEEFDLLHYRPTSRH